MYKKKQINEKEVMVNQLDRRRKCFMSKTDDKCDPPTTLYPSGKAFMK
jgi:hypothetical protein